MAEGRRGAEAGAVVSLRCLIDWEFGGRFSGPGDGRTFSGLVACIAFYQIPFLMFSTRALQHLQRTWGFLFGVDHILIPLFFARQGVSYSMGWCALHEIA